MNYQLDYAVKHIYDSRKVGITIKTTLRRDDLFIAVNAKIDTGAESGNRQNKFYNEVNENDFDD